ncbi:MAG: hypothetical protein IKX20_09320 [Paludibacteraceae bacterium]|nr:hypothetical protein [Paludibacteraceae bacterium]
MRINQILLDILCILIIGLAVFFFAGGFAKDWAEDFFGSPFDLVDCLVGLFIITSLLAAIATCICRLCRIHFKFRKAERIIAIAYLCLAVLSIYPLLTISAFATLAFYPDASQWLIVRNNLSVLAMDLSVFWLAVLSAKLLVRTRK